jgi:hypothetical protein
MLTTTNIQIEVGESELPQPVLVKSMTATASCLPGMALVESNFICGRVNNVASSNDQSVEVDRLVAMIRRMLQRKETV